MTDTVQLAFRPFFLTPIYDKSRPSWNCGGGVIGDYRGHLRFIRDGYHRNAQIVGPFYEDWVAVVFPLAGLAGPCRFPQVGISRQYSDSDPCCDSASTSLLYHPGGYADDVFTAKTDKKEEISELHGLVFFVCVP